MKQPFKKIRWKEGMIYAVPLEDGSFGIAQAVEAMMPTVIYVALFSYRYKEQPGIVPTLRREDVVSLTATWRQDLNGGKWASLGAVSPVARKKEFPNEAFAVKGYVGAKHYDAGLLADFLSAYHGLTPWNVMYKEDYWDELLAPGVQRPEAAVVLPPEEREAYRLRLIKAQEKS